MVLAWRITQILAVVLLVKIFYAASINHYSFSPQSSPWLMLFIFLTGFVILISEAKIRDFARSKQDADILQKNGYILARHKYVHLTSLLIISISSIGISVHLLNYDGLIWVALFLIFFAIFFLIPLFRLLQNWNKPYIKINVAGIEFKLLGNIPWSDIKHLILFSQTISGHGAQAKHYFLRLLVHDINKYKIKVKWYNRNFIDEPNNLINIHLNYLTLDAKTIGDYAQEKHNNYLEQNNLPKLSGDKDMDAVLIEIHKDTHELNNLDIKAIKDEESLKTLLERQEVLFNRIQQHQQALSNIAKARQKKANRHLLIVCLVILILVLAQLLPYL